MKTLVVLGDILMAEIWNDEGETYQLKVNAPFPHIVEQNVYSTMYEIMEAAKKLVPVPCRQYVGFIDCK